MASALLISPSRITATVVMARASIDENARPAMLSAGGFTPPEWAKLLNPAPSSIYSLAQLPTPIHRWDLPNLPAGTEVWIKRDDLSGMQLSGNKVRKLEFLMRDAKLQGADCVITIGGIQSNHCRATAVAARYLNLDCYLILRTNKSLADADPGLVGNLLVERLVGANVELVSKEDYVKYGSEALGKALAGRLEADGRKPYIIPVGGSNSLGTWGYINAAHEIEQQMNAGTTPCFQEIIMACGSGGTTAGLALGNHLSSLSAKVHAYTVCDSPKYFYDYIQGLLDGLNANVNSRDIVRLIDAKGLGYAMSTTQELELVKDIAEATGVVLDPVYSGKALYAMIKDMVSDPKYWQGKKVLFVHTGGLLGMYDKLQQIQPIIGNWKRMAL